MEAVSFLLRMVPPCPPKNIVGRVEHHPASSFGYRSGDESTESVLAPYQPRSTPSTVGSRFTYYAFLGIILARRRSSLPCRSFGRGHDGKRDHGGCRSECQRRFLFQMVLLQAGGR